MAGGVHGLMTLDGAVKSHLGTTKVLAAGTASELRDLYAVFADRFALRLPDSAFPTALLRALCCVDSLCPVLAVCSRFRRGCRSQRAICSRSMQSSAEAALWPLVKTISLQGPWELLSHGRGVILVDAPGIGDDNSARDARAQHILAQADAVWLCSNITRAVNDAGVKVR
jgi:hypothetical protein